MTGDTDLSNALGAMGANAASAPGISSFTFATDALGKLDTMLAKINDMGQRMRELAVQSANATNMMKTARP